MLLPLGRTSVKLFRHVQHSVLILVSIKATAVDLELGWRVLLCQWSYRKNTNRYHPLLSLPYQVIFQDCSQFTSAHSAETVLVTRAVHRRKVNEGKWKLLHTKDELSNQSRVPTALQNSQRPTLFWEGLPFPPPPLTISTNAILSQSVMLSQASCNPQIKFGNED